MPELRSRLEFEMTFSPEEYERLSLGHIPRDMDDKWFIFLEAGWLNLHRSWTGTCVYQCRVEADGANYKVAETWANRDPAQYKETNDRYDCALLAFLINNLLLGKHMPFPVPGNLPPNAPQGAFQHSVAGTGYRETVVSDETESE
jgi:hypothetical protein